ELGIEAGRAMLAAGFTTVIDLGNSDQFLDAKLSQLSKERSDLPRVIYSGPGLASDRAQFSDQAKPEDVNREYSIVKGDADILIAERIRRGAAWLERDADSDPGKRHLSSQELKDHSHRPRAACLSVAIHATMTEGIDRAIDASADVIHHAF